MSFATSNRGKL